VRYGCWKHARLPASSFGQGLDSAVNVVGRDIGDANAARVEVAGFQERRGLLFEPFEGGTFAGMLAAGTPGSD
jgi:hypothetical protein